VVHRVGAVPDHDAVDALLDLRADALRQRDVLLGPMFSLNTPKSFSVSRLQMSASSGTEP
jgi:hypothetical protein